MIVRLLSMLDVVVASILIYTYFFSAHWLVLLYAASYLFIKTSIFYASWASWVDAVVGLYLLLVITGVNGWFALLGAAWLLYKSLLGIIF